MQTNSLLRSLFDYKAWANDDLLDTLQCLDDDAHAPDKFAAMRILNHVYVVDRLFAAHLQRAMPPYSALNTPETPSLTALHADVQKSDGWFIEYADTVSEAELAERVDFSFVDGSPGCMTRGEMLMHVITHGNFHRGGVGRILSTVSVPLARETQTDAFTVFLHAARAR